MEAIEAQGVPCGQGTCPEVYLETAFQGQGSGSKVQGGTPRGPDNRLPVARELGETSLMFQVHPTLGDEDMRRVGDVVIEVMEQAAA